MDALDIAQWHLRYALQHARERAEIAEREAYRARAYVALCEDAMSRFLLNKYPKSEKAE